MKTLTFIFLIVVSLISTSVSGQSPSPTPDEDVVKITSKLVQFDVIVTDKDGKQVTDLNASDFNVLQDGKPQSITNFTYVDTRAPKIDPGIVVSKRDEKTGPLPPPGKTRTADIRRLITFVVDDGNCSASPVGLYAAREGLQKFINEQMVPGDAVSIYRTRGGSSVLQQYTADKQQLLDTASKIRWYPSTGVCGFREGEYFDGASDRARPNSDDFQQENSAVGSIGLMHYIVRGLARLSGRKLVFFLSSGIPLGGRDQSYGRAYDALRDLTDASNRGSVVFIPIGIEGLTPQFYVGSDYGRLDESARRTYRARSEDLADGLQYLASETGGTFYRNQNSLGFSIAKTLDLEKGYYLLAYEPDDATFKGKNFNKIEVKLKRPELKAISRKGFLGVTDESLVRKKRTSESALFEAIVAPLPQAGLNLQMTAFFTNASGASFVRALIHIDGADLTFVDDGNGQVKAVVDVVAVTLDEKNTVIDEFNRTHTFKVDVAAIPLFRKNGVIYSTDVPVKKPGTYNFRVAVRDAASGLLGSNIRIVTIPDLKRGKLFVSGLTLSQVDANGKFAIPSAAKPENALSVTTSPAVPAIRRFRAGDVLAYIYAIYNARMDKVVNDPKLSLQVRLYRDGKVIAEQNTSPANAKKQPDGMNITDHGYLRLSPSMAAGDYALQVVVKDLLAQGEASESSDWIDFEVVR